MNTLRDEINEVISSERIQGLAFLRSEKMNSKSINYAPLALVSLYYALFRFSCWFLGR